MLGWGGWGELEEGGGSGLKPERRAGVHRERLSLEGWPGDLGGVLSVKGRQVGGTERRVMGAQSRSGDRKTLRRRDTEHAAPN